MDDLFEKLEELRKSLLSLKSQQSKNAFVPSLKTAANAFKLTAPSLKMPTKIPGGLPPPSKKDPVKVAQQLKNPNPGKVSMEVLKVEDNGQWNLSKEEKLADTAPSIANKAKVGTQVEGAPWKPAVANRLQSRQSPVDAAKHGWAEHNGPSQQNLIHGLKLHESKPIQSNGRQGAAFATSDSHPHTAVVKNSLDHEHRSERGHNVNNFNSARREVMFHNLARDYFGLGQHVPTTGGFTKNGSDWSAMHKIEDASHPRALHDSENNLTFDNPNHGKILKRLNNQGTLDKMAIMDNIMGHHDRHDGNYMMDDKGDNMHLVDNGTSFDYDNLDAHPIPFYRNLASDPKLPREPGDHDNTHIHPEAKKWLQDLSPDKAREMLATQGHGDDSVATKGFLKRLTDLQDRVNKPQSKNSTFTNTLFENTGRKK